MKVWEAKLDNRYQCEVERVHDYAGRLTVTDTTNGAVLLNEEVTLSFAAMFGPDVADVADWQEKCAAAVDKQDKPA